VFARRVAPNLTKGEEGDRPGDATGDYVVDEAKRTVAITEEGVAKVEKLLGIDNMYESVNTPLIHHLQNSLKAKELFKRDREYIVVDGEVKIVDENTGRVLEGRRYSEGLHQSIEAKENVRIKEENQTLATITLQNYYRTYDKLAGMTGTAKTEEVEFLEIYELGVVEVPTNRPVIRDDRADLIFKTEKAKFDAVAQEIEERHAAGQPILIGTTSVEKSEYLATLLTRMGIKHEVLNAKNHAREAHIVAQAGRLGAVTVSTNMAGRGTDIHLGGNAEEVAKAEAAKLPPETTEEERLAAIAETTERLAPEFKAEGAKVKELGGLYVIGTERHDSRRVDNQLRGRSGRQGDPGTSRFFLSLEDDLMRLFNASAVEKIMTRLKIPEDVPIEHKWVTKAVANAQRQVESLNFDRRKNVLKYDDVMNEQRKVVYGQRQRLLEGDYEAVEELAQKYVEDTIEGLVDEHCPPGVYPEEWDLDGLAARIEQIYDSSFDFAALDLETIDRPKLVEDLLEDTFDAMERREAEVGGHEVMREIERRVILSVVDRKWREHLYEMDALRDGIGLRAVGQRDPLTEYQREAYDSFVAMMSGVKEEAVTYFFRLPVKQEAEQQSQATGGAGKPAGVTDGRAAAGVAVGAGTAPRGDRRTPASRRGCRADPTTTRRPRTPRRGWPRRSRSATSGATRPG
jgi:preprotein translocase subunit SecA